MAKVFSPTKGDGNPCIGCDTNTGDCYCETRACYDGAMEEEREKKLKCFGGFDKVNQLCMICEVEESCKVKTHNKQILEEEYYYYQCQEKNCEISMNQPKPCMIAIPKDQEGSVHPIFCIGGHPDKVKADYIEISKEVYDNINLIAAIKQKECSHCSHIGNNVRICTVCVDKSEFRDKTTMIPTMRVNYFDGSYYTVRKDKPGWEYIIESLNRKKGAKFLLELTKDKQLSIIQNVDLIKITEVEMTEEDYMKIPALPELGEIQNRVIWSNFNKAS